MTETENILNTLRRYAKGRLSDVERGLESRELSALLVEKYAVGIVDSIRTLGLDIDINAIASEADLLCRSIDPLTEANRQLRYSRVAKLDLSTER